MKKIIVFCTILFFIFVLYACFIRTFYGIVNYKCNDTSFGIIIERLQNSRSRGNSYLYYKIKGTNNAIYFHNDEIKPALYENDTVQFRYLHYSNSVRILKANGKKIQSYYNFADYFSWFVVALVIFLVIYKLKKYEKFN